MKRIPTIEITTRPLDARTFVVPIDFSSPSLQALRWAVGFVRGTRSRVLAVHAIETSPLSETDTVECLLQDTAMEHFVWCAASTCAKESPLIAVVPLVEPRPLSSARLLTLTTQSS